MPDRLAPSWLAGLVMVAALAACSPGEQTGAPAGPPPQVAAPAVAEAAPEPPATALDGQSTRLEPTEGGSRRFALVFGNGAYRHGDALPAAPKDAMLIARALRARGYHVLVGLDRSLAGMREDLHAFGDMSRGAELRLVYFAGHGFEFDHANYLMPVDLPVAITSLGKDEVRLNALRLDELAWPMEQVSGVLVAIVDACRVSPSRGASSTLALAAAQAPQGTILAYATSPGSTAADSLQAYGVDRDHSPYAYYLASALSDPKIERWDEALLAATNVVQTQTRGAQSPWMNARVSAFPAIGPLEQGKAAGGDGFFGAAWAGISPERRALGAYWAAHEMKAARTAGDRQMFEDELRALADKGDDDAALALAYRLSETPGREREAIALLEPLAGKGDAVAQLTLGTTLHALPARDSQGRKANHWWRQASANGMGEARGKLALAEAKADVSSLEEFARGLVELHSAAMSESPSPSAAGASKESGDEE